MKEFARLFAALADENRLRLLHLMREGEICVCYLQGALQTNQPRISRHLAYLRRSGLVEATRKGKWMYYHLRKQPGGLQRIVDETLGQIGEAPQAKVDRRRAQKIQCAPGRFGLSQPDKLKVKGL